MKWLEDRRKLAKLRTEAEVDLARIEKEWRPILERSRAEWKEDFPDPELENYEYELAGPESVLAWISDRPLIRLAGKFGIDISSDWFVTSEEETGLKRQYLSPHYKPKLKRLINEARFDYWKKWTELVVPILALLIALVALLKSH